MPFPIPLTKEAGMAFFVMSLMYEVFYRRMYQYVMSPCLSALSLKRIIKLQGECPIQGRQFNFYPFTNRL